MTDLPFLSTHRLQFRSVGTLILFICFLLNPALGQDLDVPYEPSPMEVVDAMLDLARIDSSDYVIDLGSGDGRIVIAAAERGAIGHGVDLDPRRIREARSNARQAGVDHRVLFRQEDLFETDFSQASVVTMYLWPQVNIQLRSTLLDVLRPNTRVISHSHDMNEWQPDAIKVVQEDDGTSARIYLWIIPARIDGTWTWITDEKNYKMAVSQEFQEVRIQLRAGENVFKTESAVLQGNRVAFTASRGNLNHIYSGYIQDNQISGIVQMREGAEQRIERWEARLE